MKDDNVGQSFWIVDYDLPEGSVRRRFYRAIDRYIRTHHVNGVLGRSSLSVIITQDRDLADYVFQQASQLGRVSMFRAVLVKRNKKAE